MKVDHSEDQFGYDMRILDKRIQNSKEDQSLLQNYYTELYRNVSYINPKFSKWGMYEQAKKLIFESRKAR